MKLNSNTTIVICPSAGQLFESCARLVADACAAAIKDRGQFTIALSGGSTPKGLFELLAQPGWQNKIDWSSTHVFWGDERYVPLNDARSNYRMARQALLNHIAIPPGHVHPVSTELPPDEAARQYEQTLRDVTGSVSGVPKVDYNLLGLGENGHTASLFPHRPTLHERTRLVVSDFIPEVDMHRITMTVPVINASRKNVFLVSGASKAAVVRDVIAGSSRPEDLPAQLIKPEKGELLWMLDSAAAENLPPEIIDKQS